MLEVKALEWNSLQNRAARALEEIGLGNAVLNSVREADEIYNEPFERVKQQFDYRAELDRIRHFRENQIAVMPPMYM